MTRTYPLYILHKLPTPYNDMFFEALKNDSEIDLQVYHLWRGSSRRPWKTELAGGYPNKYMRVRWGTDWEFARRAWSERESFFMIGDWGHLSSLLLLFICIIRGAPVAIWTDTPQEHLQRSWLKGSLRSTLLRWLFRRVDVIFASGQPAIRVLEQMGAPPEKLVDLPLFVSLQRPIDASERPVTRGRAMHLRELVGCDEDGVVFSINATIDLEKKGQDLGLSAFARCRQNSPVPLGLLVAGEGPDRAALETFAQELDVCEEVAFLGWQEPGEMDAVYLASDVVLHPAHYDPFPLVILEAMSWGKTVIGSDRCGSVEERVVHGLNGYSFEAGNLDALVSVMMQVAKDADRLELTGCEARKTAELWPVERGVQIVKREMKKIVG